MKLFGNVEAVKFQEENLIFVTKGNYLYYIYNIKSGYWRKHRNAGNDCIAVSNYQDISREELMSYMNGVFPTKETDFLRLCAPEQLWIRDMFEILTEDYEEYMGDYEINEVIYSFLLESDICYRTYIEVRKILDNALANKIDHKTVLAELKKISLEFLGRDIFKPQIGIVDGHDCSSYFWIRPVRVIDFTNTDAEDNVAEMRSLEISIEEEDVAQYLKPFLGKYFDRNLSANRNRVFNTWEDDAGNEHFD